jgi:hypothetical protein
MNSSPAEKGTWKVVSPPPALPLATADHLLAGWRGTRCVVQAEALDGGIMNWTYAIRLSGSPERFVLRFYDRAPSACAKEVAVLALVRTDVPGRAGGAHPRLRAVKRRTACCRN